MDIKILPTDIAAKNTLIDTDAVEPPALIAEA
jgi:hypothetical protein